jgi:hypothetical protein
MLAFHLDKKSSGKLHLQKLVISYGNTKIIKPKQCTRCGSETDFLLTMKCILFTKQSSSLGQLHSDGVNSLLIILNVN